MIAEIGLGLSVVAAGLWSGLLLTVTTILHPLYGRQDAVGFATEMRRFLPIARRSPTNYILVIALLLAPAVALVGLWIEQSFGAAFVLTATGLFGITFFLVLSLPWVAAGWAVFTVVVLGVWYWPRPTHRQEKEHEAQANREEEVAQA